MVISHLPFLGMVLKLVGRDDVCAGVGSGHTRGEELTNAYDNSNMSFEPSV